MRTLAALVLGLGLAAASSETQAFPALASVAPSAAMPAITKVEYFCSPGYEPTYGGRCVATQANDQIELFVDGPVEDRPIYHHPRHHHGLRAKY